MSVLDLIKWLDFPSSVDKRGILTSIESGGDTPFEIKPSVLHASYRNRTRRTCSSRY